MEEDQLIIEVHMRAQKRKDQPGWRPTKRLLGQILVDGDFISPQELEAALKSQKEADNKLGEILVRMDSLNPMELKATLSVQRDLSSLESSLKAAAGIRERLGQLLLKATRITPDQLDTSLREQRNSGKPLGEVLVRLGLLSKNELRAVLTFQRHQGGEGPVLKRFRLGELLVATEQISREQLKDIIARQKTSQKKIGELLVEAGYAQPRQIDCGLKLQKKLVTAAFIAALSMANMLGVGSAHAGNSSTSAKINVSATVLERTSMRILNQAQEVVITNADILRGYVEIPAASRIHVKSNNVQGCFLTFEVLSAPNNVFNSFNVVVGGREVQLSKSGGWIHQPFVRGGITINLNYRFAFSKDAQPGTYSWPLMVSVLSV